MNFRVHYAYFVSFSKTVHFADVKYYFDQTQPSNFIILKKYPGNVILHQSRLQCNGENVMTDELRREKSKEAHLLNSQWG